MAIGKVKPLQPLTGVAGLGNIFKDAADVIADLKSSGVALSSETAALVADIETVRAHVRREHEDFNFKVGTLGNGGGDHSEPPQAPPPASPAPSSPAVEQATVTFPSTNDSRA